MSLDLPLIWALLIAVAVFAYVVLDGFDLGVGILAGLKFLTAFEYTNLLAGARHTRGSDTATIA